jgi:exopolysaccharide biosynthesis polyprenyl glycosylphosphotransferase
VTVSLTRGRTVRTSKGSASKRGTLVELAPTQQRDRWARRYARVLVVGDTIVVAGALVAATRLGSQPYTLPMLDERLTISLWAVLGVLAAVLLTLLSMTGSRAQRTVGVGSQEYRAVGTSTLLAFAGVALVAYVLSIPGLHVVLALGLVFTLCALLVERWVARQWLVAQRRAGRMTNRVLVVGTATSSEAMVRDLARAPSAGLQPVGVFTPEPGSIDGLVEALDDVGADTVLISSANELSPDLVRALSWKLEPGRQHLVVAPSLTDIGGPRIHTRPVAGLPLVHIETPRYNGGKLYAKRAFDIVASGALIVLLAPVLIGIAVLVRTSSDGPVLFRQKRVGLGGEYFDMLKFRSMYVDAEARLSELQREGAGNEVMFKMKDDPRVTRVGAVLRRFSLDELPQLFNVFAGSMSLVGPRPPLEREVQLYATSVHRRFLVKPGITGLWQVSGRSDLDWDATVRLDLFYVENWTMTGDILILLKTFRAVVGSQGAY